jgi:hypothetical protein
MKIGCVVLRGEWTVWIRDGIGFAVESNFAENDTALMRKQETRPTPFRYREQFHGVCWFEGYRIKQSTTLSPQISDSELCELSSALIVALLQN